ncbi:MAG TPA: nucleotide-binding protein [Candidatus Hypogeohydataceae bacterium YC41]
MSFTIALAGKGGTGKTTLAALTVRYIIETLGESTLGVDADPNSSLGHALGVEYEKAISDIREGVIEKRLDLPAGMSKERYIEYCIEECIVERPKFDLLVMGRPEGPGCYCYVNNLLRKYLDKLGTNYSYVVLDNEAGMEHLSRRTTNRVDLMLVVCEPTVVGVLTAKRIIKLTDTLPLSIKEKAFVLNKVPHDILDKKVEDNLLKEGLAAKARFFYDDELFFAASSGISLLEISKNNPTYQALGQFLREYLPQGGLQSVVGQKESI